MNKYNKDNIIYELNILLEDIQKNSKNIKSLNDLKKFKSNYLNKDSFISKTTKIFNSILKNDKKEVGMILNKVKKFIYKIYYKYKLIFNNNKISNLNNFDITIPSINKELGNLHPISIIINKIEKKFTELGFKIEFCNEIDSPYNNFDLLNFQINHPSRKNKDTFWINCNNLLRTQTTNIQSKIIKNSELPIKVISYGRVYRNDKDKIHYPMFHQLDGIYIDKNLSFSNLKYLLINLIKYLFDDEKIKIRFRPSYFPFTEPSIEMDIYFKKKWIEILGAGMINIKILENFNINKDIYSGLAFGIGIERLIMIKYNIENIKCFFNNDLRFIKQFKYI